METVYQNLSKRIQSQGDSVLYQLFFFRVRKARKLYVARFKISVGYLTFSKTSVWCCWKEISHCFLFLKLGGLCANVVASLNLIRFVRLCFPCQHIKFVSPHNAYEVWPYSLCQGCSRSGSKSGSTISIKNKLLWQSGLTQFSWHWTKLELFLDRFLRPQIFHTPGLII